MGTPGRHVEAKEVRRDEPNDIAKLNATAKALGLPDKLRKNAKAVDVKALSDKIKAAVDKVTK